METIKFSKNVKLNNVLNSIYDSLLSIHDTKEESILEIEHYKNDFPKERDYNLYQYGNVLVYNEGIKELYKEYASLKNVSIEKLISIYKRQVGYVARYIIINKEVTI